MTSWSRTARWIGGAVAVTAAAVGVVAGSALAHPVIQSLTIQGEPVVGSTLTAVVAANDPAAVIEYRWQRCTTTERSSCSRIQKAPNAPTYTVDPADLGNRLAVRALVTGLTEAEWSQITAVVTATAPTPTLTPTPTPTPGPSPTPDPGDDSDPPDAPPTFDQSGGRSSVPSAATLAAPASDALQYLRPFPVVRVKGTLVPRGARISLLRVKAPSAATIRVRCKGRGCSVRRRSFGSGRIRALERFLRAGTRITIRISKPDAIGKYVRLVIRNGSAPKRRDACLLPGGTEPADCPSA
jgi:hypothetical protein